MFIIFKNNIVTTFLQNLHASLQKLNFIAYSTLVFWLYKRFKRCQTTPYRHTKKTVNYTSVIFQTNQHSGRILGGLDLVCFTEEFVVSEFVVMSVNCD